MVAGVMRRRCNASYDMMADVWMDPLDVVQGSGCTYLQLATASRNRSMSCFSYHRPASRRREAPPARTEKTIRSSHICPGKK